MASKGSIYAGLACVAMALSGIGYAGYQRHFQSLPGWDRDPQGQATADDYNDVKEGMVDYRYGTLPEDEKGEEIVGVCAALIPDIKAAMADGVLTNAEAHNLRVREEDLYNTYTYTQTKNEALAAVGKPAITVPECREKTLFQDAA